MMLARCIIHALGGEPTCVPGHVPAPLSRVLVEQAAGSASVGPLDLSRTLSHVARECFGPPQFVKLHLV